MDDPATMDADAASRWLAGRGLPGVAFVFWDSRTEAFVPWQGADGADRRRALEAVAGPPPRRGECAIEPLA